MPILFTDGVIPTTGHREQICGGKVLPYSPQTTVAYAFISSSSRFHPSLTGLAVSAGEECRAMVEMTPSFPADLVLSETKFSSEP